jgi:iron-sulfur cluster assembly protein
MADIVTLESKSSQDAAGAEPQPAAPHAPAHGVQVTPKAVNRIRAVLAKEGIAAEEGGLRERDRIFTFDDVRVFIDPKSFVYLNGMTLDYEETLMRQGFNFINPSSARSCGCGTSFSV